MGLPENARVEATLNFLENLEAARQFFVLQDVDSAASRLTTRVQQLRPQVPEFIRGRFKNCHYSRVSCSGSRGFLRFKAANTWACSVLVVDSPALGCEPFRVMR